MPVRRRLSNPYAVGVRATGDGRRVRHSWLRTEKTLNNSPVAPYLGEHAGYYCSITAVVIGPNPNRAEVESLRLVTNLRGLKTNVGFEPKGLWEFKHSSGGDFTVKDVAFESRGNTGFTRSVRRRPRSSQKA
ncbi:hypothetical protein EVAR_62704_1 [Eumeta japonica]|uniref:Uncharacterized protein n=1 Tax=Eumeta variegata TaxID=151549 RepID=A0A4C1ZGL9_EUMVA|nr:hypothetical protein EVAR_62704_1 [Eumeta japonica]